MSAETARAGTEVENIVGVADSVFIVLDDKDGIAEVAELQQGLDEAVVVALMQANGGLVENIEHAAELGADLGCEPDALSLSAGERGGVAVESEVIQTHRAEEFEPLDDFAANALGHQGFACGEAEIDGGGKRAVEGQRGEVGNGKSADFHGERLRAEALAAANRAGRRGHVGHHVLAIAIAARLFHAVAQEGEDAMEAGARSLVLWRPVDQDVLVLDGQVFKRKLEVDLIAVGCEMNQLEQILRSGPRSEAAVEQRF